MEPPCRRVPSRRYSPGTLDSLSRTLSHSCEVTMNTVRSIRVRYHFEPEGWWAESEDLPGWTAAGKDFAEVREQVRVGIAEFVSEPVSIVEKGVPEPISMAGVWVALTGTSSFVTPPSAVFSLVPTAARPARGVGPGQAIPDDDL